MKKLTPLAAALLLCGSLFAPFAALAQSPSSPSAPSAAAPPEKFAEKLRVYEDFVRRQMERAKIPGMTIGFVKDDFVWVKGFGYADLENKLPAKPESAYRLASVTKPMTALAVLLLAQQGKINLDAEVQTYVPDYAKQKWPVTVRQLLTHFGGGQVGSGLGPEYKTTKEVVALISKYPIETEPGTKFIYTTSGYNLLGAAVENVSGATFENYLRENVWRPLGMNDTRIDNVIELVPNRVRGYQLVNGEVKNAQYVDVSTRFGGGGATGTVPDLLRFGRAMNEGKLLSKELFAQMYTPMASKAGYATDYALGWVLQPLNGRFALHHQGGQKGTTTHVFRTPSENFVYAMASNLEEVDMWPFIARLHELLFDEPWTFSAYADERFDRARLAGMQDVFIYGGQSFDELAGPHTRDPQELARSFAYFNEATERARLQSSPEEALKKIGDGHHPVAGLAFIKLGSYMAARLEEKYGAGRFKTYHAKGAIPFFADYVQLYKADPRHPKELRFTPEFEKTLMKWNADWTRTWNDYTRQLRITPETDFDAVGPRLRKEFAGATIYPDFTRSIQLIQSGVVALRAAKLGVELYPHSDELLFNWGLFIIVSEQSEEGRAALKQVAPEHEPALAYFRRALEVNPNGVMRARTFLDIAGRWLARPERYEMGLALLRAGLELHPNDAALNGLLGDYLLRKGDREQAATSYRKAFALDPNFGKGVAVEEFIARKLKPKEGSQ